MIRDELHEGPIYDGLKRGRADPIPGWNDHSEMFRKLLRPGDRLAIDCGAWLGRSSVMLANAAPEAEILAIDTFTGALEMWTDRRDQTRYGALKMRHGFPTLYHDFRQNIFNHQKEKQVTPFPVPSAIAWRWLALKSVQPDLVFIDASHDYPDVVVDILGALLLAPRVICGDDYQPGWPGVMRAVGELVPAASHNAAGFWWKDFSK